jgi:hypothetical protein
MAPDYDPRRSRPRPAAVADPEAAPVEALFGPEPEESDRSAADQADPSRPAPSNRPPRSVPTPRSSAPSVVWQLAPLLAVLAAVGVVVWWLTRRRDD